jgi:predicted NBD/HSP70 family sugar kinase
MYYIGIDIGGTNIRSALIKKTTNITNLIKNSSSSEVIKDIISHIRKQIEFSKQKNIIVKGIGISIGGIVDKDNGEIINVSKIGKWSSMKIKDNIVKELLELNFIEQQIIQNIIIDNDGNCAAHCEKYFGNAIGCNNFINIVLGTGVGIGIYVNNQIIQFSEFGYLVEHKCSGKFFDSITENRDIIISEGSNYLGNKIADLCNIVCPDKLILNGPLLNITNNFKKEIQNAIYKHLIIKDLSLIFSNIDNQGLLGSISVL